MRNIIEWAEQNEMNNVAMIGTSLYTSKCDAQLPMYYSIILPKPDKNYLSIMK